MTPRLFIILGFVTLSILGWLRALTRRRDDLSTEHIATAWQHRRCLRPTGEPRVWRLP